jgi:hypothetical protein
MTGELPDDLNGCRSGHFRVLGIADIARLPLDARILGAL